MFIKKTGAGGLSRKLSAILMTAAMLLLGNLAFGQANTTDPVSVAVPQTPIIANPSTTTVNEVSSAAESLTNSVFIDLNGINPNINITQTGSTNTLGTSAGIPFLIRGDNINLATIQSGTGNSINGSIFGSIGGTGITANIQQIGDTNSIVFNCGVSLTNGCDNSQFNWLFTGNQNTMNYNGIGTGIQSNINVTGGNNSLTMDIQGNNAMQSLNITGDYNTFNTTQLGGGASGHSLTVGLIGSNNTFTTYQSGTNDQVINVQSISNNGTFSIRQQSTR
jgi:hypothetical protein